MKVVSCLLTGLDAQSQAIAEVAVQSVFPDAAVTVVETIDEALKRGEVPGLECWRWRTRTRRSWPGRKGNRLDRVAPLGGRGLRERAAGQTAEVVTTDEWDAARVAHVLRAAVLRHELVRENIRLKGDLLTIARRITHDLRTPIGAIVHTGEMLKEILAETDASHDSLANPLFDSVEELGRVIGRVSLITKASSTQTPRQHLSMTEVVWAVLQRYQPQILKQHAGGIVQPESWPEIEGVAPWLKPSGETCSRMLCSTERTRSGSNWASPRRTRKSAFGSVTMAKVFPPTSSTIFSNLFDLLHRTDARKGLGLSIVRTVGRTPGRPMRLCAAAVRWMKLLSAFALGVSVRPGPAHEPPYTAAPVHGHKRSASEPAESGEAKRNGEMRLAEK